MPLNSPPQQSGFSRGLYTSFAPFTNQPEGDTLPPMQWRRGFTFAAVHFTVALSIVVAAEHNEGAMLRNQPHAISQPAQTGEATEESFPFDPCNMTDQYSLTQEILIIANPPAVLITNWSAPCPSRWSVSGMLLGTSWEYPTPVRLAKQRIVDLIFLLLIATQWLLIGGLPLRPKDSLRRDPAALITIGTAAACALVFIPQTGFVARIIMLIAALTWLYWLALLAWKLFISTRLRISGVRRA